MITTIAQMLLLATLGLAEDNGAIPASNADLLPLEDVVPLAVSEVRNQLNYPYAAKFLDVRLINQEAGLIVCGRVNDKNTVGNFTGFQRFVSNGLPEGTHLEKATDRFRDKWKAHCNAEASTATARNRADVQQDADTGR